MHYVFVDLLPNLRFTYRSDVQKCMAMHDAPTSTNAKPKDFENRLETRNVTPWDPLTPISDRPRLRFVLAEQSSSHHGGEVVLHPGIQNHRNLKENNYIMFVNLVIFKNKIPSTCQESIEFQMIFDPCIHLWKRSYPWKRAVCVGNLGSRTGQYDRENMPGFADRRFR